MGQVSNHRSYLGFRRETVVCVPPADWAANNDGIRWIQHLSADTSSIAQAMIADPTLERRIMSVGGRYNIRGIRNTDLAVGVKLHGTGVVTDPGDEVVPTYLSLILEHCMGGVYYGTSHTVAGGTSTVVELDDVDGVAKGCMIAFQDTTAPSAANAGKCHPRRVIDIDADEKTVTLSEALPFSPAVGDVAHGCATAYPHEYNLEDSVSGPNGVLTWSWFVKKERNSGGTEMLWELLGTVASFEVQGLERGALPSLNLKIQAANWRHGGVDGLANPTITGKGEGHAQLSMGRDAIFSYGTFGQTPLASVDANAVAFAVGFERTKVETTTEKTNDFEGLASYSVKPAPSKFSFTLLPYQDNAYADQQAETRKRLSLYMPGDGSGAGKGWCIHMACAQIAATPKRADVGDVNGIAIEAQSMEPDDITNTDPDLLDLEVATFVIAIF